MKPEFFQKIKLKINKLILKAGEKQFQEKFTLLSNDEQTTLLELPQTTVDEIESAQEIFDTMKKECE